MEFLVVSFFVTVVWVLIPAAGHEAIISYLIWGWDYGREHPRTVLELLLFYLSFRSFWFGVYCILHGVHRPAFEKLKAKFFFITRRSVETKTQDATTTPTRRSVWDAVAGALFWGMAFGLFPNLP
jgi:hypothetical protein